MNAGDSTTPCGVSNRAARAAPTVVSRVKSKLTRKWSGSDDRHRVAVRVEAIALGDRFPIRVHRQLVAGKRRDEHDERRTGQVKVRHERVDGTRPRGRPEEDTRLSAAG